MKYEAIIGDDDPDNIERVEVTRLDPLPGQVPSPTFLSIYDDGDDRVTFLYSQVDDIIEALQECKLAVKVRR